MSARRALLHILWLRRSTGPADGSADGQPAEWWGRVGAYDAVTRDGVLVLQFPDTKPTRR